MTAAGPRPREAFVAFSSCRAASLSPFDRHELKSLLEAMRAAAACAAIGDLELTVADDGEAAALNAGFMNCAGPTNILTFPGDEDIPGSMCLSLDCLARECFIYNQDLKTHFIRLLAHGMGHLAGLDHGVHMAAIEKRCFEAAMRTVGAWGSQGAKCRMRFPRSCSHGPDNKKG